ncbi:MAG TPA: hypothetical protein VN328_10670 [Thermodesulfovibrionales bacterium]|nr:hypothetical protein [Thermodesulfovibrionales bacterium]
MPRAVLGGLCLVMLAAVCSGTEAATDQWKYIGTREKGERFFYDAESVLLLSQDVRQVWIKELSENPERRLIEINCSFKIVRDVQVISEGKKKIQLHPVARRAWQAIEKDAVMKELHKVLCR